jgi:hypothetical protein
MRNEIAFDFVGSQLASARLSREFYAIAHAEWRISPPPFPPSLLFSLFQLSP